MAFITASLSERVKLQLPKISLFIAVLIMILPINIPGLLRFMPLLDVIIIYYWAIYRPDTLSLWFVFLMGMIVDIFYGMPLGVTSLINMTVFLLVNLQRKLLSTETFMILWAFSVVLVLSILVVKWLLFMAILGERLPVQSAAMQWLFTVLFYPLVHNVARYIYRVLPEGDFHA